MEVSQAVTITRKDRTAGELRAVAAKCKDAKAALRMLSIAMGPDGYDRKTAAEVCGMDRQTLRDWVRAGPDRARDGVVRWRRIDLKHRIEAEFGVVMHERTVGKHLAALGFRRLSVRPQHPESDPEAQEAFKKTSPPR